MEPVDLQPAPGGFKTTGVRIGVDLGQKADPTAFVVVEMQRRPREGGGLDQTHFVVRALRRMELGVTYPAVARRLVEVTARLRANDHYSDVWIDATGLGQPVVELLRDAGLTVKPVYLTGSDQVTTGEAGELRIGKALLVSRLQVLLQSERIHLPASPEAGELVDELLNYEIRINDSANAQFGAFKIGARDDLATALALACWEEFSWAVPCVLPPCDPIEDINREMRLRHLRSILETEIRSVSRIR